MLAAGLLTTIAAPGAAHASTGGAAAHGSGASAPAAASGGASGTKTPPLAYDLVSAGGKVTSFGGAANYGGEQSKVLRAPIVGMAPTPDGKGYWLVEQNGAVYNLGDAGFYGSGRNLERPAAHDIIAIVPTADGKGYWLCDASGIITPFGDAKALPSLKPVPHRAPIVGFSVLPDDKGGWVVSSTGVIFRIGDVPNYGSLKHKTLKSPIVAMARSHNGEGYWLTNANGRVWAFGNARPVARPPKLGAPVVSISAAPASKGYWAVSSDGSVIPAGVPSQGDLSGQTGSLAVVAISATLPVWTSPYASGDVGYDVNWPQCAASNSSRTGTMPGPPKDASGTMAYSVAIIGVDGWAVDDTNPCLAAEVSWAKKATPEPGTTTPPPYELYMFLNSPASTSTIDQTGPAGTCTEVASSDKESCLAYNYGYNAALDAVAYATSNGASSSMWWLDIENDTCAPGEWNDAANGEWWSCDTGLNDLTIQGALDGLRHDEVTAGVYSTAVQWKGITGGYVPTGGSLPLWIAGAYWTSPPYPESDGYFGTASLSPWCQGDYDFAGGTPVLLQETPGDNNYPYDPDYAC